MAREATKMQLGTALDPDSALRVKHIKTLARGFAESTVEITQPLERKIEQLLKRVEELEARPLLEYTGVYEGGREYQRGAIVTHDGSMWFCKATTRTQPPSDAWQCCVKRGRDARER